MIVCSNCGNNEMPGALFCMECGTQFSIVSRDPTMTIPNSLADHLHEDQRERSEQFVPPTPDDASLSLFLVESGEVIPLEGLTEYTLGRSAEDQPILPDIDLAPYHAYEYGVSRLHASIRLSQPHALLTDFDSANGTLLNGQKLSPDKPYPITHGDIFSLGKMKIQLLVNREES
jgi:pSer/pThr/pTyr-binding forkhead associated (FHA) protein